MEVPQSMEGLRSTSTTSPQSMGDLVRTINGLRWTMVPKAARPVTRSESIRRNECLGTSDRRKPAS